MQKSIFIELITLNATFVMKFCNVEWEMRDVKCKMRL